MGGDAVALDVHRRFRDLAGLHATEVCGMTECFNYAVNPPFDAKRLGSIGRPPPGTELRLVAGILGNGWLHTGDVARRDADGWYWFVARSKELIIRDGSNVAPGEVEATLYEHSAVSAAVVVGVPDPELGQRIAAWVRPRPGTATSERELAEFVRGRIAEYKTPEWI